MAKYMTEAAYMRWLRQYRLNLNYYFNTLDDIRIRLVELPNFPESDEIEKLVSEIEEKLEEAIPRNFHPNVNPLQGGEKLLENCKVMINLILKFFKKDCPFSGIYHKEKEEILNIHHEFEFKEKIKRVQEIMESVETPLQLKNKQELVASG